jgi:hypothetical protein
MVAVVGEYNEEGGKVYGFDFSSLSGGAEMLPTFKSQSEAEVAADKEWRVVDIVARRPVDRSGLRLTIHTDVPLPASPGNLTHCVKFRPLEGSCAVRVRRKLDVPSPRS